MKRRTLTLKSLVIAASILLSGRAALGADTIWDILRKGEIPQKRDAPSVGTGAQSTLGSPPLRPQISPKPRTIRNPSDPRSTGDITLSGNPAVDPNSGQPQVSKPPKKRSAGVVGFFDGVGDGLTKLGKRLNSQIKLSGEHSWGWHMEDISGSDEAYFNDNYFGRRGLGGGYNQTELTVQGKVLGVVNFTSHYSNNAYINPYENQLSLNYETRKFKFDAGDINGSIVGNSLLDFNRTIKGLQVSSEVLSGLRLTTLVSQPKANTRTVVIPGANTSGPYYVYAGQVVDGSERVRVNNRDQVKGEDYTLDPYTGELRFIKPGTIILQHETIAVTFETYGYNQSNGTLSGYRAEFTRLKNTRMGFTMLEQRSPNSGSNSREKTDLFQGYENPLSPYVLTFPVEVTIARDANGNPVSATPTHPMKVFIDALPQTYGTDYQVSPLLPNQVFFRAAIPRSSLVKITYTPVNDNEAAGNRSVLGFDSTFSLGKMGLITAEMASSKLDISGRGVGGSALQLRGDMKFLRDKLSWNWSVKDIGADFTAIESPGFRRNEKGYTMGFNYNPSASLRMVLNMENTKRPSYDYSGFSGGSSSYAAAKGTDKYDSMNFQASYQLGKNGQVSLNHNNMTTLMGTGGKTSFGTDNLQVTGKFGQLSADLSFGSNSNYSMFVSQSGTSGSTPQTTSFNSKALTSRLSLNWIPTETINLGATVANSQIQSSSNGTTAQDMQVTATYSPWKNLQMNLAYNLQNSGGYSPFNNTGSTTNPITSRSRQLPGNGYDYGHNGGYNPGFNTGFNNGYGGGNGSYYGGGFNGGLGNYGNYSGGLYGGSGGFSGGSFGGDSRMLTFGVNYQPWSALSLTLNWNKSSSEGDYLFNSNRNDINLVASYNVGENFQFSANYASQNMKYIGSTGGGTSTGMLGFMIRAMPLRRLQAMINYSRMQTNSSQPNQTGNTGGNGNPADPYGGLYGNGGTGYYGFFGGATNMNTLGMRLEYPIWKSNNLYWQMDNSTGGGYGAADVNTMVIGVDFPITETMSFSLGWRTQRHNSKDTSQGTSFNYSVNSIDADLNFRFR